MPRAPEHLRRRIRDKVRAETDAEASSRNASQSASMRMEATHGEIDIDESGAHVAPLRLEKGAELGRYKLIAPIGEGSFGVVWKVVDLELPRWVALKILRPDKIGERERFVREGEALAQLNHPNVVQVYDVGKRDPLFIAMEHVDGETLRTYCARLDESEGRASWRAKLAAYLEAGKGLAAAHSAGLIHRDFKPDNVLRGKDGRVRVADFGLARASRDAPSAEDEPKGEGPSAVSIHTELTRTGGRPGSPLYMALEVHDGKPADAKSDQFSFCVALFRALFRASPFPGKTEPALREAKAAGVIAPPTQHAPGWLWRVLVRGLRPEPAERYASMDELLEALGKDPRRRAMRLLAGIAAVLLACCGGWLREQQHEANLDQERERANEQSQKANEERQKADQERQKAQEADERAKRAVREREDRLTLREVEDALPHDPTQAVARLETLSASAQAWEGIARIIAADAIHRGIAQRELRLPANEVAHGLSADARTIVTRNPDTGEVRLLDITTGEIRTLATTDAILPVVEFSPDGRQLAALRLKGGVGVWNVKTLDHQPLGETPEAHNFVPFSPGGTKLVTYGRHPEVHVWDLASGKLRILGEHAAPVEAARVSPGGGRVATVDNEGVVRMWDPERSTFTEVEGIGPIAFDPAGGLATATTAGDMMLHGRQAGDDARRLQGRGVAIECVAFSADGKWLAAGDAEGGVRVWTLDTGASRDLLAHQETVHELRITGALLTAASHDRTLGVLDLESGRSRKLRGHMGVGFWAVTPLGRIVTVGREKVVRQWDPPPPVGSKWLAHEGRVTVLATGQKHRVATGGPDGVVREWDGKAWQAAVEHDENVTALSYAPDGVTLASADARGRVLVRDAGGSILELERASAAVRDLTFTRSGKELVLAEDDADVSVLRLETGKRRALRTEEFQVAKLHACADGETLATAGWLRDGPPQLRFYRLADAEQTHSVALRDDGLPAAAFSADCQAAAVTTFSRVVMLWRASTGELTELEIRGAAGEEGVFRGQIEGVSFSPDGRTLATACTDGSARLWDVATGRSREIMSNVQAPRAITFTRDGLGFVAGGDDALVYLGRDDLPHDPARLREWIGRSTEVTLELLVEDR